MTKARGNCSAKDISPRSKVRRDNKNPGRRNTVIKEIRVARAGFARGITPRLMRLEVAKRVNQITSL
jgi:hypothetical protein